VGRELNDPETGVRGGGESAADGREDPVAAQGADGMSGAECDVDGVCGHMPRPRAVGHVRPPAGSGLSAGTGAPAAPGWRDGKRELCMLSRDPTCVRSEGKAPAWRTQRT